MTCPRCGFAHCGEKLCGCCGWKPEADLPGELERNAPLAPSNPTGHAVLAKLIRQIPQVDQSETVPLVGADEKSDLGEGV